RRHHRPQPRRAHGDDDRDGHRRGAALGVPRLAARLAARPAGRAAEPAQRAPLIASPAPMIELSDEQRALQELAHAFAERELRPVAREVDEADVEMRWDVWRKAAGVGLTSFMLPEAYGGGGVDDAFTECLIQEELYWGDAGFGGLITSGG